MPPFPQPEWDALYPVDAAREIAALRAHRRARRVPRRSAGRLLLATWNIANLGLQERGAPDYEVLAEIVSWFDVVAVQETNDNLAGIRAVMEHMPAMRRMLVSDASGNRERGAFIYDTRKVSLLDKVGRLSIPPSDLRKIKVPGTTEPFRGFDRGPFMAAFATRGDFRFLLVNVHLYFGGKTARHVLRRAEETYALAWWADRRHRSQFAYVPDIIPLGDFNLPQMDESDRVFKALTKRGLRLPPRGDEAISQVGGTSLGGLRHYDQIALFPGETTELRRLAIFDFDRVVFKNVYDDRGLKDFLAYTRFHLSDHRPLWAEFAVGGQSPS